jgi:acetyl esterase/lipase
VTEVDTRDAGLPQPAGTVAFSSVLDATRSGERMATKTGIDPLFTREPLQRLGAVRRGSQPCLRLQPWAVLRRLRRDARDLVGRGADDPGADP